MAKYIPRQRAGSNRDGMDPDRFQMKDLKRRLTLLEKAHDRLLKRHDRLILRVQRDQNDHDQFMKDLMHHFQ